MKLAYIFTSIAAFLTVEAIPFGLYSYSPSIYKIKPRTEPSKAVNGNFLHVTDIHLDSYYLPGSDPATLCHRNGTDSTNNVAGIFGTPGSQCDSPATLIVDSFGFMKKELQNVDFILYTGDTARHDRDPDLLRTIEDIPTIGNNDVFKKDNVGPDNTIFQQLQVIWSGLNLNLTNDFLTGGYFVQDIIPEKLQAISVNTIFFFEPNLEIEECKVEGSPGYLHISWIQRVLRDARKSERSIYIVGHVPPKDNTGNILYKSTCYDMYINLLGSYSDVIVGQFYGHTNSDALSVIVEDDNSDFSLISATNDKSQLRSTEMVKRKVVGVLFNAPSIIPVYNPAIRVFSYTIKSANHRTGTILDWIQYYADISSKANEPIKYVVEYVASELFGVSSFDVSTTSRVFTKLAKKKNIMEDYIRYMFVSSQKQ
ncbi:Metallo-dependent phosphatase-like protein [Phycomyces blakesleeanus]|uniref:Metallo-dependent phosphatase-like protein n=1 Tax=Phycomyces blakesleeanus TaxID=4837 RepID=A0ABR3BFU1_PHYBL